MARLWPASRGRIGAICTQDLLGLDIAADRLHFYDLDELNLTYFESAAWNVSICRDTRPFVVCLIDHRVAPDLQRQDGRGPEISCLSSQVRRIACLPPTCPTVRPHMAAPCCRYAGALRLTTLQYAPRWRTGAFRCIGAWGRRHYPQTRTGSSCRGHTGGLRSIALVTTLTKRRTNGQCSPLHPGRSCLVAPKKTQARTQHRRLQWE